MMASVPRARQRHEQQRQDHGARPDIQRRHLVALRQQRQQEAGAGRILHHAFARRQQRVADRHGRVAPCDRLDLLHRGLEEAVVVACVIGVEAGDAEALEQVRLAQVAEVVVDAAALAPVQHRPGVAGEDRQEGDAEHQLQDGVGAGVVRWPQGDFLRVSRLVASAG